MKDEKQDKSTLYVALSTLALGVLVVFYMQVLNKVSQTQLKEDPLDKTAKLVSRQLSSIKIKSETFGDLSMSDLDEIKAAIKNAYLFAKSENQSSAIEKMILLDLDELEDLENKLAKKLQQEIGENGGITNFASEQYKSRLPASSRLFTLKISFGSQKEKDPGVSHIRVAKSDEQKPFSQSGFYKTNFPVELNDSGERRFFFHKHYDKTEIFEPKEFVYVTPDVIPSTIFIEATIEQCDNTNATRRIIKQTCATIGFAEQKKPRLCYSFRFPQGLSKQAKLIDFLKHDTWSQKGEWYQASKGPVPGRGQLGPATNTALLNQTPDQALMVSLYHWMRQNHSKENIDPAYLKQLLSSEINDGQTFLKSNVNSCLLTDALLPAKKDPIKQDWQKGLYDLFEYQENLKELPGDAFPIVIDVSGNANIPGRNIYDQKLIGDYLEALYRTNLAALETLEVSRLVMGNSNARLNNLKMEVLLKEQELKALSLNKNQDQNMLSRIEIIQSILKQDKKRMEELQNQFKAARLAGRNAQIAILRTFDLASHNLNTCRAGLHRIDTQSGEQGVFLLNRKEVFKSCQYPLSDQKLIESTKNVKIKDSDGGRFLDRNFSVISSWQTLNTNDKIDEKPLDMVLAEEENINCPKPLSLLLTSDNIYKSYQSPYVFAGLPVSEDQLFYYAPLSYSRQKNVYWQTSVRDLVCKAKPGQPLEARSQAQFVKADFSPVLNPHKGSNSLTTGVLAGEFQLRRPIVKDLKDQSGVVLRDSSWKKESPIIPPIPLDML
ncbi:MAG: hypothetical protein SFY67_18775 [Candidatus Melainabacteria bacterium]|nr:hypothetical protein [Candidatus Melainabacteria bacterium]